MAGFLGFGLALLAAFPGRSLGADVGLPPASAATTLAPPGVADAGPTSGAAGASTSAPTPFANATWKGTYFNYPRPEETIDPDPLGVRTSLEGVGLGYFGFTNNTAYTNVLHAAKTTNGQQVYIGQSPTGLSLNFLGFTYDLSRFGIPDGQIVALGFYDSTSWNPLGPNSLNAGTLSYYQTAFDRRVEFKIGLMSNSFEYVGPYVAGSLNGGVFGVSGSLFFETGQSSLTFPTYGANVTVHPTTYFYDKFGVARATDPDGAIAEHANNPTGLNLNAPNAGAYFINEFGYKRAAAPGLPRTWVRAGASVSTAKYRDLEYGGRRTDNYATYLLADRQLWQASSSPKEAFRGLYAGFSVEYVPPEFNRFSQYYEARVYGLGLIPGRVHDQTSLVISDTVFSNFAIAAARRAHQSAHSDSVAITASYSANVVRGIYANSAVSYINNPSPVTYTSKTGSALNLIGGFTIYY